MKRKEAADYKISLVVSVNCLAQIRWHQLAFNKTRISRLFIRNKDHHVVVED